MNDKLREIREAAESDLITFIKLIAPHRVLGSIHEELCRWWTREDHKSHQICLLPRDHGKSAMVAYRAAWYITKHPDCRILYISSTANLAEKQLKFIKDILTSDIYRRYWPEMVNKDEGKREKWTSTEIMVDHPKRKEEGVRDPTVFIAGLTTGITGLHCDVAILDDVVVGENAYTKEGRDKVSTQYSYLSSIEGGDAQQWVVGTRYHPNDLYDDLVKMQIELFDKEGDLISEDPVYEIFERVVEVEGEFLWPRQQRRDGRWFGFNAQILGRKRAQYLNKTQFYAQYYNDPNDPEGSGISPEKFNYYERKYVSRSNGYWYYKQERLNVFASIDFAFSLRQKADYTAIVVVGVDKNHNYYVLDIERFKTDKVSEYFKHILHLHQKWDFRKLRAEVTVAQQVIVRTLKDEYIRQYGLSLSIDEYRPTRNEGNKFERIAATLEPRYDNGQMWHYRGGNCQILEEELVREHSTHDDVKDALAAAVDVSVAPTGRHNRTLQSTKVLSHPRFGGI
jgi:phage terminase large subunit-like protein